MTSRLELNSRAALCRQLAKREPATRTLWMAEAENWSLLVEREASRRGGGTNWSRILAGFGGGGGQMSTKSKHRTGCLVEEKSFQPDYTPRSIEEVWAV